MSLEPDSVKEHVFVKIERLEEEQTVSVKIEPGYEEAEAVSVKREPQEGEEGVRVKTEPREEAVFVKTERVDGDEEGACFKPEVDERGLLQPAYATFEVPVAAAVCKSEPTDGEVETVLSDQHDTVGQKVPAEQSYECDECGKRYTKKDRLRQHVHSHERMRVECRVCKKRVSPFYMRKHLRTHDATAAAGRRRFACALCEKVYRTKPSLDAHVAAHGGRRYGCDLCPQTFLTRQYAKRHARVHESDTPHECDVCHKRFKYSSSFHDHKKTHSKKRFACELCPKKFAVKAYLAEHMFVHTRERGAFACDSCELAFRSRHKLERHRRTHSGAKPFPCDVCGRAFTTAAWLRQHRAGHAGRAPQHACADCGKRFTQRTNLADHSKIHSGEMFECAVCGDRFASRGLLRGHRTEHDGPKYSCGACGKGFTRPGLLAQHRRRHEGESREPGPAGVPRQREDGPAGVPQQRVDGPAGVPQQRVDGPAGVPQQREKKHAGVPASTCQVCGKTFPLASSLQRHMNTWHEDAAGARTGQTETNG